MTVVLFTDGSIREPVLDGRVKPAPGRMAELVRLSALDDAELAERGLTRDGIARFVLADRAAA